MSKHDELIEEAEKLAASMKQADKIDRGFVYSFVANHELQILIERVYANTKLLWGLLLTIVMAIALAVVGAIVALAFG